MELKARGSYLSSTNARIEGDVANYVFTASSAGEKQCRADISLDTNGGETAVSMELYAEEKQHGSLPRTVITAGGDPVKFGGIGPLVEVTLTGTDSAYDLDVKYGTFSSKLRECGQFTEYGAGGTAQCSFKCEG